MGHEDVAHLGETVAQRQVPAQWVPNQPLQDDRHTSRKEA